MKIIVLVCALLLALSKESEAQLTHDIRADSILAPKGKSPTSFPGALLARFTNVGTSNEANVLVGCTVRDRNGLMYRDTVYVGTWNSGQTIDVAFANFTPQFNGIDTICALSILSSDQNHANDMTCAQVIVAYGYDAQAMSIQYPKPNDSIPASVGFQPVAIFQNVGVNEIRNGPAKVVIRRCADQMLVAVFQQTNLNIPVDSLMSDTFPSQQGSFNTKLLPPGCYQIVAIARIPNDGDRSNDTAFSTFTIYATHDISADTVLGFAAARIPTGTPHPIKARYTNRARNDETNVKVSFAITLASGVVYRDSATVASLKSGQTVDVSFKDWTPTAAGQFDCCAMALLATDQLSVDDTTCANIDVSYAHNLQSILVLYPESGHEVLAGSSILLIASFRNAGMGWLYQIPVSLIIRRCSDLALVYRADTIIDQMAPDSLAIDTFPSRQAVYDTKTLLPGCYRIAAIARYPKDECRLDDTAFAYFTIGSQSAVTTHSMLSHGLAILGTFPNPASASTTLAYSLPESGDITLRLLDVTGREGLRSIAREDAGEHQIPIQTPGLEPGIYLCQLTFVNARGEVSRAYSKVIVSGAR